MHFDLITTMSLNDYLMYQRNKKRRFFFERSIQLAPSVREM